LGKFKNKIAKIENCSQPDVHDLVEGMVQGAKEYLTNYIFSMAMHEYTSDCGRADFISLLIGGEMGCFSVRVMNSMSPHIFEQRMNSNLIPRIAALPSVVLSMNCILQRSQMMLWKNRVRELPIKN
jgi:hypothetical protein